MDVVLKKNIDFDYYAAWYENDRKFLQQLFKQDWQLVAALLAATSPQVQMIASWQWTMRIYRDYSAGRKVRMDGLHKCHRKNVIRALSGQELSGRKVGAFYLALIGDNNAVVLDVWMLRLLKYYPEHKHNPEGKRYDKLADRFRVIAKINNYKPAEFQAALWIKYRLQNGYKPVSYSTLGDDKKQLTFADLY